MEVVHVVILIQVCAVGGKQVNAKILVIKTCFIRNALNSTNLLLSHNFMQNMLNVQQKPKQRRRNRRRMQRNPRVDPQAKLVHLVNRRRRSRQRRRQNMMDPTGKRLMGTNQSRSLNRGELLPIQACFLFSNVHNTHLYCVWLVT